MDSATILFSSWMFMFFTSHLSYFRETHFSLIIKNPSSEPKRTSFSYNFAFVNIVLVIII